MRDGMLRVQVHANCRLRRIYFAERLYSDEELPPEFKLYLPVQEFAIKAENTIIEMYLRLHTERIFYWPMTRLAPSKVFLSSIATVIRPTPPGTPLEASEKSTSPTNRYPDFI
ncbi:hypothetical protein HID58_006227 [Brassica napus]|uniref:BnaA01g37060D protein n=3 Tax=Brassica TaxID=3705 RepID=A0A078DAL1_BRANA|nr:hypothetical protein HID58_006227 [Brassica napus]CAG7894906.1 unnamed protein product [Brassica rapa]CAF1707524.1 unnamed protein product [Brassica napus]CAF2123525.1 unnamed protein product [Brassica napus]CDY60695.1 BnaA01g37060D [Brassica napus]